MTLAHITKSFGAMRAVDDVSLAIAPGSIVALVGENGAGKTTLMRIAAGELTPDSGSVEQRQSAGFVHQHFQLVPELSVAENLALGTEGFRFAGKKTLLREAARLVESSGIALAGLARRVADLSVGEKSKLELVKAIARNPSVLILDEPTSVLTPGEAEELFAVMRRLARTGTAIVFISHKLPEVLEVAERIVVMREGRVVAETDSTASATDLAAAMLGKLPPATKSPARPRPSGDAPKAAVLQRGPLSLYPNEIVAIVGVAGNGQAELASRLREELPEAGHIPEDRTRDGIVAEMTLAENLALRAARWSPRDAARRAREMIELYSIRASGPLQRAGALSGGNQQKLLLARELDRKPSLIIAAEPTRGLDFDAMRFVHARLRAAAAAGAAILLITSDLDEAFDLAGTLHVINRGTLSAGMTPQEASTRVAGLMAGVA